MELIIKTHPFGYGLGWVSYNFLDTTFTFVLHLHSMTNKLLKTLFSTFIISTVLNITVTCIDYSVTKKNMGYDFATMLAPITSGAVRLNIILLLMVSPVLFFSLPHIRNNIVMRIFLYFAGPVVFLITASIMHLGPVNRLFYLETGLIFMLIHSIFYFTSIKKIV